MTKEAHFRNVIRSALVATLAGAGCSKPPTTGDPIAWSEISTGAEGSEPRGAAGPPACAHRGDGRTYVVEGYPHWAKHSPWFCRNDDCFIEIVPANDADGAPLDGPEGWVSLTVKKKGMFGGLVEPPKLHDVAVIHEGVTSGKSVTTSGQLEKDSLELTLSDGSTVNNRVRIRAFFRLVDLNGGCVVSYVGGVRSTSPPSLPRPPSSSSAGSTIAASSAPSASASPAPKASAAQKASKRPPKRP